ncbi:MAG TPA: haloacid dehalogenase-like hydrolase [Legionellaceae bacterium]|nr:haloacid dehalogenase-like hydrolase [Legionellaceae bacterium]
MTKTVLCVDLDGTLILTDTTLEATLGFIRAHPWQIWKLLWWLCKGRAYLKQQLGKHVILEPSLLPYHPSFLQWLKAQKAQGTRLVLATATDQRFAQAVARYLGIFDDVFASDGKQNLRAHKKAAVLTQRYGYQGYDYAGNSRDDLEVWKEARHAILVNSSQQVKYMAQKKYKILEVFD